MADAYLPKPLPELILWYGNFNTKIGAYATPLGLLPADITAVANDFAYLQYIINAAVAFDEEARERFAYRDTFLNGLKTGQVAPGVPVVPVITPPANTVTPGLLPRIRALVKRIKASVNYTEAMGKDLGIIAATPVNPVNPKPKMSGEAVINSSVRLKFTKNGNSGVFVESQRGGETTWTRIGFATVSPYVDNRAPLAPNTPEVRKYRALYFKKDVGIGDYSDIVSVTTTP